MEKNIPSDVPRVIIAPVGPSINLQRQVRWGETCPSGS